MLGLVLTARGARGAYQAGVLKRIAELAPLRDRAQPFEIVAGASAGAINGAILAARSERFGEAADEVARVWSELEVGRVFRTDLPALALGGASLLRDFTLGSLFGWTGTYGLLDTSPSWSRRTRATARASRCGASRRSRSALRRTWRSSRSASRTACRGRCSSTRRTRARSSTSATATRTRASARSRR